MAPEQSGGTVDRRADIYALGVVLYEMLTGERPEKDLIAPSKRVEVSVKIDEMVLRALEKEPERRYQTAGEFRTMVETIAATPPNRVEPKREETKFSGEEQKEGNERTLYGRIEILSARYGWLSVIAFGLGLLIILGAIGNFNSTQGVEKASMMMVGSVIVAGGIIGAAIGSGRNRSREEAVVSSEAGAERWKALRRASYLGILAVMVSIAGIIFMVKVVPQWEELWQANQMELGAGSQFLVGLSHLCQQFWPFSAPLLLLLAVASVTGFVISVKRQAGSTLAAEKPKAPLRDIAFHGVVTGLAYVILCWTMFESGRELATIDSQRGIGLSSAAKHFVEFSQSPFLWTLLVFALGLAGTLLWVGGRSFGRSGLWIAALICGVPVFGAGIVVALAVMIHGGPAVFSTSLVSASLWLGAAWLVAGCLSLRRAESRTGTIAWWALGLLLAVVLIVLLALLSMPLRNAVFIFVLGLGSVCGLGSLICGLISRRTRLGRGVVLAWGTGAVLGMAATQMILSVDMTSQRRLAAAERVEMMGNRDSPTAPPPVSRLIISKERGGRITPDGILYSLDGEMVAMEKLQERFQQKVKERPELQVIVYGNDPELPAGRVIAAMQTARAAGVKHPRISTGEALGEEPADADRGADGVVVELISVKQGASGEGWEHPVLDIEYSAINRGDLILHLPENGLRHQVEVDGKWYEWVDPRLPGDKDGDAAKAGSGTLLLDFGPGDSFQKQNIGLAGGWYEIPTGKEEAYAVRRNSGTIGMVAKDDYGDELILKPGNHKVRVAVIGPSARAIQGHGVTRSVSQAVEVDVVGGLEKGRIDAPSADAERGADGVVAELKVKRPDGGEEVGRLQAEGIDLLQEVLSRKPAHVRPADRGAPLEPPILLEWEGNKYAVQSDKIVLIGKQEWTMWLSPGIDEKLIEHSDVRVIQGAIQGTAVVGHKTGFGTLAGAIGFLLLTVLGFLMHRRINPGRHLEKTALFLCVAGVILPLLILIGHLFGMEQAVVATVAYVLFAAMQLTALILGIIRFSEPLGRAAAIASGVMILGAILFLS
jgi:hypothetical protein